MKTMKKRILLIFLCVCNMMLFSVGNSFAYSETPVITITAGSVSVQDDGNYSCNLTVRFSNHGFASDEAWTVDNSYAVYFNLDYGTLEGVTYPVGALENCTNAPFANSRDLTATKDKFRCSDTEDIRFTSDDIVFVIPLTIPKTNAEGDYTITMKESWKTGFALAGNNRIWVGYPEPTTSIHLGSSTPATSPTITADTSAVGTVTPGSTFSVPVKLSNNTGFTSYVLQAVYDNDLELTDITAGNVVALASSNTVSGQINATSSTTVDSDGTLFNLTFKVKDSATSGDKSISLKLKDDDTGNFCNDDQEVTASFEAGSVTVNIPEPAAYSAYLSTEATEVKAGETFDADLYLKGSNITACSTVLKCENGTIEAISPAAGLSNAEGSNNKFSFYGGNSCDFTNGVKVATVKVVADSYLAAGDEVTLSIDNTTYFTVAGKDISPTLGNDKSVSVEVPSAKDYESTSLMNSGKSLVLYGKQVDEGNIVKYKDQEMLYSDKYKVWVCLVDNAPESLVSTDFTTEQGTVQKVDYTGDLNGENGLTATDMQLAYDIATGATVENLTDSMLLSADANGNKSITTNDARYIQCLFHGLDPEKDA